VAEVAPIGGFGKQYQVNVDPNRLQAYGLSINRVVEAVRAGNYESSGRLIEFGGTEYSIRGRGYVKSLQDLERIAVATSESGPHPPQRHGEVTLGPDLRRGVGDLDGKGDVVSGIVIMRHGQNALDVIERSRPSCGGRAGLPAGVKVVPIYDRSDLILRAIDNLKSTVIEVLITVALVVFLFLWHIPSALIPVITLPVVILLSFIPFRMMGLTANIMSLGGIAIAIGAMVDASIVVVEQTHKSLEIWDRTGRRDDYRAVVIRAVKQVAGPSFFALLVIAVSFLPVLTLVDQEGRLFKPLAYTKNLAMILLRCSRSRWTRPWASLHPLLDFDFRPDWLCRVANAVWWGASGGRKSTRQSGADEDLHPVAAWSLRWRGGDAGSSDGAPSVLQARL
jgi:Cu(I)/Ag(I) efflux system membrane protein CusA/SilA